MEVDLYAFTTKGASASSDPIGPGSRRECERTAVVGRTCSGTAPRGGYCSCCTVSPVLEIWANLVSTGKISGISQRNSYLLTPGTLGKLLVR